MDHSIPVTSLAASLESGSIEEAKTLLRNQRAAVRKIPELVKVSGIGLRDFAIDPATGYLIAYYTTESQVAALLAAGSECNVWVKYNSEDLRAIRETVLASTLVRNRQLHFRVSSGFDPNVVLVEGNTETIKVLKPLARIPGVELSVVDDLKCSVQAATANPPRLGRRVIDDWDGIARR